MLASRSIVFPFPLVGVILAGVALVRVVFAGVILVRVTLVGVVLAGIILVPFFRGVRLARILVSLLDSSILRYF
jgi:hypothetical protein